MAKKTEFVIPYPNTKGGKAQWSKRFGLNAYYSGKHYRLRMQDVDYWHKLVSAEMERQNVRKFPFENPVVLTFFFNDRLDCSNHAIYAKMIEDAMKGRVIRDDNRTWVAERWMRRTAEAKITDKLSKLANVALDVKSKVFIREDEKK